MSDQGPQSNLPLLPGYSFSTTLGKEKFYKVNFIHRLLNLIFELSLITLTSVTATLCGLATRNPASAASQSTLVSSRLLNPVATRKAFWILFEKINWFLIYRKIRIFYSINVKAKYSSAKLTASAAASASVKRSVKLAVKTKTHKEKVNWLVKSFYLMGDLINKLYNSHVSASCFFRLTIAAGSVSCPVLCLALEKRMRNRYVDFAGDLWESYLLATIVRIPAAVKSSWLLT